MNWKNVTRIKTGITINVGESAKIRRKHNVCEKKIFGILLNVVAKMEYILEVLLEIQQ